MSCLTLPTVLPGSSFHTEESGDATLLRKWGCEPLSDSLALWRLSQRQERVGYCWAALPPQSPAQGSLSDLPLCLCSTELMRRVQRFQIAQYKCLVIKYAKDTRYSNAFSTHDRCTMEALPACQLQDMAQEALGADVIGIDEGQFFPDVVDFSETMANMGKTVIVAALDGTFQRKAFGAILDLVPLAESVVKLNAVCMECFREAAYTKRLGLEKEVEVIGGADKYHAVCRRCYFQKASGQPAGLSNKENCPAPGKPGKPGEAALGEVAGTRKPLTPHQILQYIQAK